MSDAVNRARRFVENETEFRLGHLPTESAHQKTRKLSQIAKSDLPEAIRMLQSVDEDIPAVAETVFKSQTFATLVEDFTEAMNDGKRIYLTGAGSTGRLSVLLEATWRGFWREMKEKYPRQTAAVPDVSECIYGIMAGGDFALIKSVEGYEDSPAFGRRQLMEGGVRKDDVVVAITEGGETPFVIGTAWYGLEKGAKVFFVFNNPSDVLSRHVERSREVIAESRIRKLELATGPMAITGSTRMQAITIEMLVVCAALEMSIVRFLKRHLSPDEFEELGISVLSPFEYNQLFIRLLKELATPAMVNMFVKAVRLEESIYRKDGLVTYLADSLVLDILTDTTERSPTFMVPPFRSKYDTTSPSPWACVKNPRLSIIEAWDEMLERKPRGLEWDGQTYAKLNAPVSLQEKPPRLGNEAIYEFLIGNEKDPSRTDVPDSVLIAITSSHNMDYAIGPYLTDCGKEFGKTAAICIGKGCEFKHQVDTLLLFPCHLQDSPLKLFLHLASKLVLNTISTGAMALMGRVMGNSMIHLFPSNKKLIDRGTRLISQVTNVDYDEACIALHQAMESANLDYGKKQEVPSPVAMTIEKLTSDCLGSDK